MSFSICSGGGRNIHERMEQLHVASDCHAGSEDADNAAFGFGAGCRLRYRLRAADALRFTDDASYSDSVHYTAKEIHRRRNWICKIRQSDSF